MRKRSARSRAGRRAVASASPSTRCKSVRHLNEGPKSSPALHKRSAYAAGSRCADRRTPAFGGKLGACHAIDIPFVFDVADHPSSSMFVGDPTDGVRALVFVRVGEDDLADVDVCGQPGADAYDVI